MRTPLALLFTLVLGACQSTPIDSSRASTGGAVAEDGTEAEPRYRSEPEPPTPWTDAFEVESVLMADEIRVEGPPGLIEHLAIRQEPAFHDHTAKTVEAGFLQESVSKGEALAPIRAKLDGLTLAAFQRLTVLERVVDGDVVVYAVGDAQFSKLETGEQRTAASLTLRGKQP